MSQGRERAKVGGIGPRKWLAAMLQLLVDRGAQRRLQPYDLSVQSGVLYEMCEEVEDM